ncbi:MAG: amidohydrolase family protein [Acidobacteriota bacterium]|nr:amidohydrolase family protein [Acidobacteriota bacterium]MDQ5836217.1 amidohydrolase family protein [Acidobacteriota bacterium]
MKTQKTLFQLLPAFFLLLTAGARAQVREQPGAPRPVVIRAARLLDVRSGDIIDNAVIIVEGERVKAVGQHVAVPAGARVYDLGNVTLLPGLIDCHTHVMLEPEDERGTPPVVTKSQAFRTVEGVAAALKDLQAGFTTMRDLDSEGAGFADVAVRDGINRGIIPGPRLLVSGNPLTITGGAMNNAGLSPDIQLPDPGANTDTREAMIAEVRREVRNGVDWVKVYATGPMRYVDPVTLDPLSQFSAEDIRAIVTEAARWHRDVAAHAYGGEGAKNAIRGGVRSLEHGMMLDDEGLRLLVEHGTYYCPTLSVYIPKTPDEDTELRRRIVASHRQVFQKALRMGVKIVFGTDVGAFEHGTNAREFELMVEYGMKPLEAIRAATTRAAELLRMEKQLGAVEPGKYADIIAVEGNPLEDIHALRRVNFVMKAGQVYVSPR